MRDNQNEKKFEEMLQLAEFGAKRMAGRRSTEFKIFVSYMTLLVLALYQLIKQGNNDSMPFELSGDDGVVLCILALFIHIIYVMWQVGVAIAMRNDAHRRNVYLKEAEEISGLSLNYSVRNKEIDIIKPYWKQFCHLEVIWEHWSPPLLVGIPTILFSILTYLFTKGFIENIDSRILLATIPILLFLVIPFIAWIKNWARLLVVGIPTILFSILTYLFISGFSGYINLSRLLAIPILLFCVIPLIVLLLKKIVVSLKKIVVSRFK